MLISRFTYLRRLPLRRPVRFFSEESPQSAFTGFFDRVTTFLVGFGLGAGAGTYFVVLPAIEASTAAVVQEVRINSTCK